ncbi:hypothetical protein EDB85DRAFT_1903535 [Lactarius pseudohatsudake]|nr:hypothetical protein EDB85DRAFT_1903535 [Lactarius pseudohatsudake]
MAPRKQRDISGRPHRGPSAYVGKMPPRPRPISTNPSTTTPTTSSSTKSPTPIPLPTLVPASSNVQSEPTLTVHTMEDTTATPLTFSFLKKCSPAPPVPLIPPDIATLTESHTSFLDTWKAGRNVPEVAQDLSDPEIEELMEAPPGFQKPTPEPEESDEPTVSIRVSTRDGMIAHLEEHITLQEEVADMWERMDEMKDRLEEMLSDFTSSR